MPAPPTLSQLDARYDLVIVGGGITGAGIFREAVRRGARALLVEAGDFASGTSSASSKLVHGGLRYLKNGQWRLTLESVRERQRLLREAPGLVEPLPFVMPIYADRPPGRWLMQFGLRLYDAMAGVRRSRWLPAGAALAREPALRREQLRGAMLYEDASTDDARLVLRLIGDAVAAGGVALNYCAAQLRRDDARVCGVQLQRPKDGERRAIDAALVVNATGAWADRLLGAPHGAPPLRPLRGSHLVFAAERLPLRQAVSWLHIRDRRPVFAFPWEGAVLCGTTDVDHRGPLEAPLAEPAELDYLLEGLRAQFPDHPLRAGDALAVYAGVRPVVGGGEGAPSSASRESALWIAPGLIGATGGKLTTFRVTAGEVLRAARRTLPALREAGDAPVFDAAAAAAGDRLAARYGARAAARMRAGGAEELLPLGATPYCLAELRWALRHEAVHHLDDLLLRRTRLGLVSARGGEDFLERVGALCRAELGWDETQWQRERERYRTIWRQRHAPPAP
ncbi:glycerol-3-phosphate dehydrogenase/oxidase [Solimonas soli]|uniref:glycerol-3-phosphate dehydrogenase/oxidase n=1 Tax=Solimonas soli TaxID=413479 RepID=UPI0004B76709|nr:glycerol-3-phosphate dehydrogenase/oxidase [Solimonas soli]